MYRILGADGKEYGPITEEVLRQWVSQGRANAQSRVRLEGSADWQILTSIPEFQAMFAAAAGPPAGPAAAPLGSERKTSGMAIASLILGVLGFCGITAVIGLILGIVAMVRINRSGGRLSGNGLAIAGVCVSGVMLLMCIPMMAAMLLPALARAKQKAMTINCMNNVRQLDLAVMMYANAHGDQFPPAAAWCDAIQTNAGSKAFHCPASDHTSRCDYGFNQKLGGVALGTIKNPANTVMIFETDGGWNQNGGPDEMLKQPRHFRMVIGFADGHAEQVSANRLSEVVWEP